MENNSERKVVEVVYDKAPVSKRLLTHFFDVSIFLLSAIIFFTILNPLMNSTPWYKSKQNQLNALKADSHLYVDGVVVTTYVDEAEEFTSSEEKKTFLSECIDIFYQNNTFFKDDKHIVAYNERKQNAKADGVNLFVTNEESKLVENNVSPSLLYDFYKEEVDHHSLGYLYRNTAYYNLTRFNFFSIMILLAISVTLFYIIYYLVLPLTIFKRGRCTIGMKLNKIGLININALNVKKTRFALRTLFDYVVFIYLNLALFLIPSFISIGMMFFTKTNQSLTNYFLNDYFVDTSNQHIYLDEGERQFSKDNLEKVSIENNDFIIK